MYLYVLVLRGEALTLYMYIRTLQSTIVGNETRILEGEFSNRRVLSGNFHESASATLPLRLRTMTVHSIYLHPSPYTTSILTLGIDCIIKGENVIETLEKFTSAAILVIEMKIPQVLIDEGVFSMMYENSRLTFRFVSIKIHAVQHLI